MPTYFIYSRKSSEAEDRQILSIDSQVSELRRFANPKGFKVVEVLTEAKSAKAPGSPIFNSMMQRLYRGEADGILCWKLDRLARNPVDGGAIIWAMKEHGVKIITPFQTYGQFEDNVVMMYLEFGMAQKYVDDLAKNVKRGLRTKAESGWFPSCTPPGYINQVNDKGRNVIARDPKRFSLVRKCWDLMLTGNHTPAEIREIANTAWGFRTKRGNPLGRSTIYGSSEKYLPGVMKTEEPENQVTLVAQTICLAKKCLDLIVDAFHAAVVDPVLPPCKNAA